MKCSSLSAGVLCALLGLVPSIAARADFVDELPALPITPAPLPSARPQTGRTPPPAGKSGVSQEPSAPDSSAGSTPAEGQKSTTAPSPAGAPTQSQKSTGGGLFNPDVAKHNTSAPISIQGDEVSASINQGKTSLTGNVVIQQDDTTMKSDVAEIFSKPGTTTPERAVAKGRVSILKRPNPRVPEIRALAEEIEYFIIERRVILKGKPKIWRGKELVQGEVIEMALDTGDIRIRSARSILDPSTQQAPKAKSGSKGTKGNNGGKSDAPRSVK